MNQRNRNRQISTLILILTGLGCNFAHAEPPWASAPPMQTGTIFLVACKGEGPSLDLARTEAINGCKISASNQISAQTKINSLSIETEKDVSLHVEIETVSSLNGLTCQEQKEDHEGGDGHYIIFVQCKFDLSKVSTNDDKTSAKEPPKTVSNQSDLTKVKSGASEGKSTYQKSEISTISIACIPKCDSLLVKGPKARTVQCVSNPVEITLYPEDIEVIARAKGFKPKVITLTGKQGANLNVQIDFDE